MTPDGTPTRDAAPPPDGDGEDSCEQPTEEKVIDLMVALKMSLAARKERRDEQG